MQLTQQVTMRNPNSGITVLTPNPEKPETYLTFAAAEDTNGGDILYVSRETASLPAVISAVRKGTLLVEGLPSNDPLKAILTSQRKADFDKAPPLTAEQIVYDEEGNATSKRIVVQMLPAIKE